MLCALFQTLTNHQTSNRPAPVRGGILADDMVSNGRQDPTNSLDEVHNTLLKVLLQFSFSDSPRAL
jgi:hypothetical protein